MPNFLKKMFTGRMGRKEFAESLVRFGCSSAVFAYAAFATLKFFELENVFGVNALILAYLFVVLILMPFVFKRLRYFGQSGWLVLFLLVPVLNILLILYLLFKSDNQ